jgi:hypothetical protein
MDFEQKCEILKTRKNACTGPLCVTNLEYGGHDEEIQSFGQCLPQTVDFH